MSGLVPRRCYLLKQIILSGSEFCPVKEQFFLLVLFTGWNEIESLKVSKPEFGMQMISLGRKKNKWL